MSETRENKVLIYLGCSSWTSANRNHAKHVANEDRKPVCGKEYKGGALDVYEGQMSEVTCGHCRELVVANFHGHTPTDGA